MGLKQLRGRLLAAALLAVPVPALAQQAPAFFFDPDHLGIEPTVPKHYFVRLVPPPTGDVQVAVSLGDCAEAVDADVAMLRFTPDIRWQRVTLTAKAREEEDGNGDAEAADEDEDEDPCARFEVLHRVIETADRRFQLVRGVLPVEITANRAPEVARPIDDQALDPNAQATFRLEGVFYEPDGDALTYAATTSNDQAARVFLADRSLTVLAGSRPGFAAVTVVATEPQGLSKEFTFLVRVGALVRLGADVAVAEGGTATLAVAMARPQSGPIAVPFAIGSDADAATPDADAGEYGSVTRGEVLLAAGETAATISIAIADDEAIEPAEELFVVSLLPRPERGYVLERAEATMTVREGVCDRTPEVRDALRRTAACTEPTVAALRDRQSLNVAEAGIDALQADDLLGLSGLRDIDLRGNRLASLPPGFFRHTPDLRVVDLGGNLLPSLDPAVLAPLPRLFALRLNGNRIAQLPPRLFAGLGDLFELRLEDNPGAPFPLGVTLTRTDAANLAPPPATVRAAFAPHAPFALASALTVEGGTASVERIALPAGAGEAEPFVVRSAGGSVRVTAAAPSLPTTICAPNRQPCFQGLLPTASPPLVLFAAPPTVRPSAEALAGTEVLAGDTLRVRLEDLFAAGDGGPLRYAAAVEPPVATWRIVDDTLLLTAAEGEEGTATVTVTATGTGGTASFSFAIAAVAQPRGFASGWRRTLGEKP